MRDVQTNPVRRPAAGRAPKNAFPPFQVLACLSPAFAAFWLTFFLLPQAGEPQAAAQDGLGELRQTVRAPDVPDPPDEEPRPKKKKSRRNAYGNDYCDDEEDPWGSLIGTLAAPLIWATGAAVTSPFWGPASLIGDTYESPSYFPSFPYQEDVAGAMMKEPWVPAEPRMWSMRLRGDYVDDFDAMSSIGGQLLWESSQRWGIDSEVRFRQEDRGLQPTDSLWTGDSNLVFRFAQSPQLQLRAGAGFNWLADENHQDFGINFTYGGDWYPVKRRTRSGPPGTSDLLSRSRHRGNPGTSL
jgi:hypothetical protein